VHKRLIHLLIIGVITTLVLFSGQLVHAQTGWYDAAWTSRQKITIDSDNAAYGLTGDLTDFPFLIKITTPPANDLFGVAQASGDDILFTDSDGTTKLSHEIENYDNGTPDLTAWVRLPVFHDDDPVPEDTVIYMYYGNPNAPNQEQPQDVWDDDYVGVWHLKEDGSVSASYEDSTSNMNTGVGGTTIDFNKSPTRSTDGAVGYSQDFDGIDDYFKISTSDSIDDNFTELSITAWIKPDQVDAAGYVIARGATQLRFGQSWSRITLVAPFDSSNLNSKSDGGELSVGQWTYIASTYGTDNFMRLYVDGVEPGYDIQDDTGGLAIDGSTNDWLVGTQLVSGGLYFDGLMDEVRLSSVTRSVDWIKTQYNMQLAANQGAPTNISGEPDTIDNSKFIKKKGRQQDYYQYRRLITINKNQVVGTHTYFPVLINLTLGSGKVQNADGYDIIFTDMHGEKLVHEIESFNDTTGELFAWVKIPTLSSLEDTRLYIYYGNFSVTQDQSTTDVWDSNYKGVWHLKEDPSGPAPQFLDSTSNDNDGTANSLTTTNQVAGKIDGSLAFDDTNERHVLVPHHASLQLPTAMAVSAWVQTTDTQTDVGVIAMKWGDAALRNYWLGKLNDSQLAFYVDDTQNVVADFSLINDGIFHHIVGVADPVSNLLRIYVDGIQRNTASYTGTSLTGTGDFRIGNSTTATQEFDGVIDEARISSTARSTGWISTEYNNQSDTTVGSTKFIKSIGA